MSRSAFFEYRAWPSDGLPHIETLHHLFGLGVAEIRTDTYIFSAHRPRWMIILRGGENFEILEKDGEDGPLSVWKQVAQSGFPLRRSVVKLLLQAFPDADLSHRIYVPGDVISWLDRDTLMFTVSTRSVKFERGSYYAEFSHVEADSRRAETFSISSRRAEFVMDEVLPLLPLPRLSNLDYASWLLDRPWNAEPVESGRFDAARSFSLGTAQVA